MEEKISIQYYIFRKKLLMIDFYRRQAFSYEGIAYVMSSRTEIVRAYCTTLLHDA